MLLTRRYVHVPSHSLIGIPTNTVLANWSCEAGLEFLKCDIILLKRKARWSIVSVIVIFWYSTGELVNQ
jgi:hypothetical protein